MKLTEKEFDIIIEALDHLPNKNAANGLLAKLTAVMLTKHDEGKRAEMEAKMDEMDAKEAAEAKEAKKMCSIITGKLYMMKDELVEEDN